MDPEASILHTVEEKKLKPESMVKVYLSEEYNRKRPNSVPTDTGTADPIDIIWAERLSANPRLFNGTKFRIHHVADSHNHSGFVDMFIGVTDYKEYLGTNWASNIQDLQRQGLQLHQNPQAFLSDALGVGACLITKDDKIILLRRSEHCAEAPGLWDVPGGHAEPKKIVGDKQLRDIDVSSMDNNAVLHEIFDSILQEVTDEVGIPLHYLRPPLYTGTHRNNTSGGRPSLAFEIKCSLSSEEVLKLYMEGNQQEADESTNIMCIPLSAVADLVTYRQDVWNNMAPSAKGNLTCYCTAQGLHRS